MLPIVSVCLPFSTLHQQIQQTRESVNCAVGKGRAEGEEIEREGGRGGRGGREGGRGGREGEEGGANL